MASPGDKPMGKTASEHATMNFFALSRCAPLQLCHSAQEEVEVSFLSLESGLAWDLLTLTECGGSKVLWHLSPGLEKPCSFPPILLKYQQPHKDIILRMKHHDDKEVLIGMWWGHLGTFSPSQMAQATQVTWARPVVVSRHYIWGRFVMHPEMSNTVGELGP